MNRLMKNRKLCFVLLAAALLLTVFSGVQTSRATLTYYSQDYTVDADLKNIGIALVENGAAVDDLLLSHLCDEDGRMIPGKAYAEDLRVRNDGTIDMFVRVILRCYWVDDNGKRVDLSPDLVVLNGADGSWQRDPSSDTAESAVWYYKKLLKPGEVSDRFNTTITLDPEVAEAYTVTADGKTIESYLYDGYHLALDVEANGVQTHNAEDAIKSAWGVDVAVSGSSMELK